MDHSSHLIMIARLQIKFSVKLKGIKSARLAQRLSVFLKMKKEGKPHQEEVKGDIFHCRTKVPFMRQLGRIQEHPQ